MWKGVLALWVTRTFGCRYYSQTRVKRSELLVCNNYLEWYFKKFSLLKKFGDLYSFELYIITIMNRRRSECCRNSVNRGWRRVRSGWRGVDVPSHRAIYSPSRDQRQVVFGTLNSEMPLPHSHMCRRVVLRDAASAFVGGSQQPFVGAPE